MSTACASADPLPPRRGTPKTLQLTSTTTAAGTYTGHFRENSNAGAGTHFDGNITQGAGENWTLRFRRAVA